MTREEIILKHVKRDGLGLEIGPSCAPIAPKKQGFHVHVIDHCDKKALIESQKYSPFELGFGKMVHLEKENFVGRSALAEAQKHGVPRQLIGLEIDWTEVEARYEKFGLTPAAPTQEASPFSPRPTPLSLCTITHRAIPLQAVPTTA